MCRRNDKMRFNDFEEITKRLFEAEVYFHDL
jgi:hypothetical protein